MKKDHKALGEIYVRETRTPENHLGITGGEFAAEQERDMKREEEKLRKNPLNERKPESDGNSW